MPSEVLTDNNNYRVGINQYNREYIYVYWSSVLNINILNGYTGYVPHIRIDLNQYIVNRDCEGLKDFLNEYETQSIFYFSKMKLENDWEDFGSCLDEIKVEHY
jgi:hypothetical protein